MTVSICLYEIRVAGARSRLSAIPLPLRASAAGRQRWGSVQANVMCAAGATRHRRDAVIDTFGESPETHHMTLPSPVALRRLALVTLLTGAISIEARAQCTSQWQAGLGYAGVEQQVLAMLPWDPDGAGPAPAKLAIGGSFRIAGTVVTKNIALYDPMTGAWSALGAGINPPLPWATGQVNALAVLPNGNLVAAGSFWTAGTVAAANIAQWDGTAWSPLGSGFDNQVYALTVLSNGD